MHDLCKIYDKSGEKSLSYYLINNLLAKPQTQERSDTKLSTWKVHVPCF